MILRFVLIWLCLLPSVGQAQNWRYDHNGSTMLVRQTGRQVEITYETPRQGLRNEGVGASTLLFSGTLDQAGYLDGMARIFRRGCGDLDYFVYGDFRGGGAFTLNGAAPVLARTGCRVVDNSHDIANANLLFTPLSNPPPAPAPVPQPARSDGPGARFCVGNLRNASSVNLRTGPGTGYSILGQVPARVCQVYAAAAARNGWQPVTHGAQRGWVAQQFLQRAG